jgi:hypothetical protein
MSVILTLRITAEQRKRWQEAASKEGLPLSGWIRNRCNSAYREQEDQMIGQPQKTAAERLAALLEYVSD